MKGTAKASCLKPLLDGFKSPLALKRDCGVRECRCVCVYVSLNACEENLSNQGQDGRDTG